MFDLEATGGRPFVFPLAGLGDGQTLECSGNLDGVDVVQSCVYGNKKSFLLMTIKLGTTGCYSGQSSGDESLEFMKKLFLISPDIRSKLKQRKGKTF